MCTLEGEYETLLDSPRAVHPTNQPTGFDHDVDIPRREEDDDCGVRSHRIGSKKGDLGRFPDDKTGGVGQALYCDAHSDVPMTGANEREAMWIKQRLIERFC